MSNDVTRLLNDWRQGQETALHQLMDIIHEELHRLANHHMKSERSNHTLQATALLNEAFMRLMGADVDWTDRQHFMAMASKMMRRVLVDHAKTKNAHKRQAQNSAMTLDEAICVDPNSFEDVLIVDDLLTKLAVFDARAGRVLELSLFGGLSQSDIAEIEVISLSTVERELRVAKAWVNQQR